MLPLRAEARRDYRQLVLGARLFDRGGRYRCVAQGAAGRIEPAGNFALTAALGWRWFASPGKAENEPGGQFCGDCGERIAEPVVVRPPPEPRAYTPKHLAEKILQSKSALEGERKQVTVLFADVKGSMDLAEHVDPEEWHRILDRFFQILSEGVHRFEGTINQFTSDGIMALFGAPIAHEEPAQRACYAALALQADLRRYANELRLEKGFNFSVRNGSQLRRSRGSERSATECGADGC